MPTSAEVSPVAERVNCKARRQSSAKSSPNHLTSDSFIFGTFPWPMLPLATAAKPRILAAATGGTLASPIHCVGRCIASGMVMESGICTHLK